MDQKIRDAFIMVTQHDARNTMPDFRVINKKEVEIKFSMVNIPVIIIPG